MASRRPAPPKNDVNMTPVLIGIVAVVAIVAFIALSGGDESSKAAEPDTSNQPATDRVNPFDDLGKVEPPKPRTVDTAPPGLLENATYTTAVRNAEAGIALIDEAIAARAKGDEATYQAKASQGRDKLFDAKESTTDWLMDLQDKHPNDRQVKQIEKSRKSWDQALKKVKNLD